jgi:L-lactate dehydrogenase complex protein LldG
MSGRQRVLTRLRQAPAGDPAPLPDLDAWHAATATEGLAARIARFKANIGAAHAEVHDTDNSGWPALLFELAARKGLRTLLIGKDTRQSAALKLRPQAALRLVEYARPAALWRSELFEGIDAALTSAKSAAADTGSVILWPSAREPRLMSLVPPVHFIVLEAATIHANLHTAMAAERWAVAMPTNALVISGPSKTADIQQTLAYGAHGPREVIVLLCHRGGAAP